MRPRIRRVVSKVEASTNPKTNNLICSIQGITNKLSQPVLSGERIGTSNNAVLKTSFINMEEKYTIELGTFRCATHKKRVSDRVADKMARKINWL